MTISWLLGTLMLWIPVTISLRNDGVFFASFSQPTMLLWLLLEYASLAGLGFFAGVFTSLWWVVWLCRRSNGAPFTVGDHVTILVGPHAGTMTTVYELTRGQAGNLLPKLDLGATCREKYLDIFEDYTLIRTLSPEARPNNVSASLNHVIL